MDLNDLNDFVEDTNVDCLSNYCSKLAFSVIDRILLFCLPLILMVFVMCKITVGIIRSLYIKNLRRKYILEEGKNRDNALNTNLINVKCMCKFARSALFRVRNLCDNELDGYVQYNIYYLLHNLLDIEKSIHISLEETKTLLQEALLYLSNILPRLDDVSIINTSDYIKARFLYSLLSSEFQHIASSLNIVYGELANSYLISPNASNFKVSEHNPVIKNV
ncbi:hypothetical protein K6025_04985 [Ehrlichia sp. JZT12]